ncbi:MAG: hypothetical protein AAB655_00585 [Patescibacteria group bacterium]
MRTVDKPTAREIEFIHENLKLGEWLSLKSVSLYLLNQEIRVHTGPAIYKIVIVEPAAVRITVKSEQDYSFSQKKLCRFYGSVLDGYLEGSPACFHNSPRRIGDSLARFCYPVIGIVTENGAEPESIITLPMVHQVYVGDKPAFRKLSDEEP